jgi:acyl carrier protein
MIDDNYRRRMPIEDLRKDIRKFRDVCEDIGEQRK